MQNHKQLLGLSVLLFAAFAQAELRLWGGCPKVQTVENFNATAYTGLWFEHSKYPFIFEFLGKCITAQYELMPNGKVSVYNRQINELTGKEQVINGTAEVVGNGELEVSFPSVPWTKSPYSVVDTDYTSYAVVWSCSNVLFFKYEILWILTREQNPAPEVIAKAEAAATKQNLSLKELTLTNQKDC